MWEWLARRRSVARLIDLWWRWERHLRVGALLAGFIFDLILADRPDSLVNNLLLVSYLLLAGGAIIVLNLRTTKLKEGEPVEPLLLLLILQFCFGGLASNLFVLYMRSGTLAASALFFLILGGMIVGNEFMRSRYSQLRFNVVIYYLLLLSYFVIAVPTFILYSVGTWQFLVSGLLSLLFISGFLALLYYLVLRGKQRGRQLKEVAVLVALVFVAFNALYFLKITPPVPLSLKEIGIYHSVTKVGANYAVTYEHAPWYAFWRDTNGTYHRKAGEAGYCFSSVFAPDNLKTPIRHRWEYKNAATGEWETRSQVTFPIAGGRTAGYRGFSIVQALVPGNWRCNVETTGGALIGRVSFTVEMVDVLPPLSTKTL